MEERYDVVRDGGLPWKGGYRGAWLASTTTAWTGDKGHGSLRMYDSACCMIGSEKIHDNTKVYCELWTYICCCLQDLGKDNVQSLCKTLLKTRLRDRRIDFSAEAVFTYFVLCVTLNVLFF